MNTNLLTIDNMLFAGATLTPSPVVKSNPYSNFSQFTSPADTSKSSTNATKSNTTDNIADTAQDESIKKTGQDFNDTLRKEVKKQSPKQNQVNETNENKNKAEKKHNEQDPAPEIPSKTEPSKSESAQELPLTFEVLVKESADKTETKTNGQIAQLINNLKSVKPQKNNELQKADKSNTVIEKSDQSATTKIPVTANNKQLASDNVIKNHSKEQSKLHIISPNTPKNTPAANKQSEKIQSKSTESKETSTNTKNLTNEQTAKEPASTTLVDKNSKNKEKLPTLETDTSIDDNKTNKSSTKQLTTDNLKIDENKTIKEDSTLTDKPITKTNEKTPISNTNFSENPTQDKIIEQNPQPKTITNENPANNPDKTSITPEHKTKAPEISTEPSNNKSKETPDSENKLSDNDTQKELNITDVQIITGQTKNINTTSNNSDSEIEQIITQSTPQTPVTEQSSNSAETVKPPEPPIQNPPGNPAPDIGKQVLESIQSSISQEQRNQQITIQLNPPELGKVSIKFQEQDDQIIGLLEVNKTQTRIEVEQAIPEIVRNLQDSGIQIKRLDVVLSQEQQGKPGQEALQDQTMQNNNNQQQGSADSYTPGNNPRGSGINEWLVNNNKYRKTSEIYGSLSPDDSINMLA